MPDRVPRRMDWPATTGDPQVSRVLVTGANGFVGRALCEAFLARGWSVRAAVRKPGCSIPRGCQMTVIGNLAGRVDWSSALEGVNQVVHAAAHVHVATRLEGGGEDHFAVNGRASRALVEAAAGAGIDKFVYLSSIKVNGEETAGRPFGPSDDPCPRGFYAQSKLMGEQAVLQVGTETGMEVSIVRPPLVYGPGVGANFRRLISWIAADRLLPLGGVRNKRSLVNIWNLVDLVVRLLTGPVQGGRVWLVSDGEDLSTPELVRRIAAAMGRPARVMRLPAMLLSAMGVAAGKRSEMRSLCGSLTVDISATIAELQWSPGTGVDEALRRTVRWYLEQKDAGGK